MLDEKADFRKMVDDIKNDRFEIEDKSDQGYSSIEAPEPKTVEAAEEQGI